MRLNFAVLAKRVVWLRPQARVDAPQVDGAARKQRSSARRRLLRGEGRGGGVVYASRSGGVVQPVEALAHARYACTRRRSLRNATYTLLRLELVCARDLPKAGEQRCVAEPFDRYCAASNFMRRPPSAKPGTVSSPYVEVAVHGGGRYRCAVAAGAVFECDATYATKVAAHNGLHPRWAEAVECVAERQDDAILSLHVYDRKRGGWRPRGVRAHRVRSIAAARDPSRISRRSAACADGLAPAVWLSPRAPPLRDAPRRAAAADDEGRKRESRRRLAPPSPPPPPPPSREGAGRPRMLITRKLGLRVVQA